MLDVLVDVCCVALVGSGNGIGGLEDFVPRSLEDTLPRVESVKLAEKNK
jgi:hypothetical protein